MRPRRRTVAVRAAGLLAVVGLLAALGCGPAGLRTYPVRGKVELVGGDISHLAGSHVEAALESDPTQRSSGEIQPDGRFTLETLHAGAVLKGAREGKYQVRIVLADDDSAGKKRAANAVARRFLHFKTSGLSFQVPDTGDFNLKVSQR